MHFSYSADLASRYPSLVSAFAFAGKIAQTPAEDVVESCLQIGLARLDEQPEAEFAAIKAWRATFSSMGLKPTQYRCASESLLRRLRKERSLPVINPLVDLCNAVSVAYAVPVAVFDVARFTEFLEVRLADGSERYLAFHGEIEAPAEGEVVFVDADNDAHARRWTHRQSRKSAVSEGTRTALIVIEGLHDTAEADVSAARDLVATTLRELGAVTHIGLLRGGRGKFSFAGDERPLPAGSEKR
ncbi:MAG: phenylalanine--tRNA ligase beta subunit-related protein [Pseudomonadota bacterium]